MPVCSECGGLLFSRGLCQKHYWRQRKDGTLPKINVQRSGKCGTPGCDDAVFARGLCPRHYHQSKHPMKSAWTMLRARHPSSYPEAWDQFESFLADVGERPSPRHQLRRLNQAQPWSGTNFEWLPPVVSQRIDYYSPEARAAYNREQHLKKKFKINTAEFNAILAAQGGVCAICRKDGAHLHHRTGKPVEMHVDHDHVSGKVRGILCYRCNTAAGLLRDDPKNGQRLIDYLAGSQKQGQENAL